LLIVQYVDLYVFCVMAITIINNVFIFIIESGYDVSLRKCMQTCLKFAKLSLCV